MNGNLVAVLEARRLDAGNNGRAMGYKAWGESLGVMYTSLFRFAKGEGTLGIEALRTLAQVARDDVDIELIMALAGYALGVKIPEPGTCQHGSKISEPGIWVCADCGQRVRKPSTVDN